MKKQNLNRNIFFGIFICLIAFTAMAFQDSTKIRKSVQKTIVDTVPEKNDMDIEINLKDIDKTIKESLELAEKSMKAVDWNKMSQQIKESMKSVDMAKLQLDVAKSMKEVDWSKMQAEINRSMKDIDMAKMQMDIQKEIKEGMKNINTEELKKSMEELKKLNFDDLKKEMENLKKNLDVNKDQIKMELDKARLEMLKAKTGLGEVKEMTSEMEKDGLINKKDTNTIEFRNKELFINGKKQSPETTEKYRRYFKGDNFKFNFNDN